jgi:sialidase-1
MTPVLLHETVFAPNAHWCSPVVECGIFPGICVNPDGSLALLAVCGSDFESADQRVVAYSGSVDGTQWTPCGDWGEIRSNGCLFNVTAKPTLLPDGTLLALGYGYERDLPDLSISEYAERHGRFPTVRNFVAYSHDGGRTYTPPAFLDLPRDGIEFSGPAIPLPDGRLLAFGPPFSVSAGGQIGLCYESTDQGHSWREKSVFHDGGDITAWESRAALLPDNRLAVIFWAFDLKTQKHLTNRLALSDDGGESWRVLDTALPGQAANLLPAPDGTLGVIYAKREGDRPGVYHARCALRENALTVIDATQLYDAQGGANAKGQITTQFYNLKFGQPSLTRLSDETALLVFWRKSPAGRYEIVIRKYQGL